MKLHLLSLLLISLSSCATLVPTPGEPPKRFVLNKVPLKAQAHTINKQVMVDMPVVFTPIDNQRIAVVPVNQQIDYFADIEWADRLATLIQESLIYSLQDHKMFEGVTRNVDGIVPDWTIKMDIRKFYIDQSKPSTATANAEYFVQLLDTHSRKAMDSKVFSSSIILTDDSIIEISSKLDMANSKIISEVIDWIHKKA